MQTLFEHFDRFPDHADAPAVIAFTAEGKRQITFAELSARVDDLAAALRSRSDRATPRIGLMAGASLESVIAALAVLRSGATLVPLDVQLADEALTTVLGDAAPYAVLCDGPRCQRLATLAPELQRHSIDARLPRPPSARISKPEPGATAAIFYTSGTTGPPKGVPLSQANLAYQIDAVRDVGLVHPGERALLPLPVHHVYPFVIGLLVPLALGLCVVLPRSLTGPQVLRAIREGEVNVIIGVPRLYRALLEGIANRAAGGGVLAAGLFRVGDAFCTAVRRRTRWQPGRLLFAPLHRRLGPNLRLLASGGAALDPELATRLEGFGWSVGVGYGLTETSPLLTINLPRSPAPASVGRTIPRTELRTVDGELQARGPGVFRGYRHRADADAEAFTEDGWFRTGDRGHIDADGFVYVEGRASTLIVTESGKNVQPEEVESAYDAHPAIAEAGVFYAQNRLHALLVPGPAVQPGDPLRAELEQAVAEVSRHLPSYQRVAEFAVTLTPLPRTRLGKIRRHLLADRYREAREERPDSRHEPLPVEQMNPADQTLLDDEALRRVWDWLAQRYSESRLSPDSRTATDLGIDSMEWLDVSAEVGRMTGVELSEERIAAIDTVRGLLQAVAEGEQAPAAASPLDEPQQVLTRREQRWIRPLAPFPAAVAALIHAVDRRLLRRYFDLDIRQPDALPDQCVFAPNHLSYLDPFVVAAAFERRRLRRTFWAGWTGAAFRNPLTRFLSRLAQAIPVNERNPRATLALAATTLRQGYDLVWFPEGGRSRDGHLQRFKPGLGRLLERYPVPVVPVLIRGTFDALPPGRRLPRRRQKVIVEFGPPLLPAELAARGQGHDRPERIADGLHHWMADHLEA